MRVRLVVEAYVDEAFVVEESVKIEFVPLMPVVEAYASVATPVSVGDAEKTTFPVPVSPEIHCAKVEESEKSDEVAIQVAPLPFV